MLTPSFKFKNKAPISASAALATTMRRIVDKVRSSPLCCCSPFFWFRAHAKMPPCSASHFGFIQVSRVGVDIQDHVAGVVADCHAAQ
jgi:hypothetical protein